MAEKKTDTDREKLKQLYEANIKNLNEQVEYLEKALMLASDKHSVKIEIDGDVWFEGDANAFCIGVSDGMKVQLSTAGSDMLALYLASSLYKKLFNNLRT